MTKAEEIARLKGFVDSLPTSYLRDTLRSVVEEFSAGIYSDFVPSVRDSWDARIAADKEVKAVRAEIASLRKEQTALRREFASEVSLFERALKPLAEASTVVANAHRFAVDAIEQTKKSVA